MLASVAALLLGPQAQQPPAAPDVVVTGERITPQEARARAEAFVRAVGVADGMRPAARWEDPICLHVMGLSERQTLQVETRIREVAQAAGAKLARGGCRPNALVTFTADAAADVRNVARKSPAFLSHTRPAVRAELVSGDRPIRWWYRWGQRGRFGMGLATDVPPIFTANGDSNAPTALPIGNDEDGGVNMQYGGSSHVSSQSQRVLRSAAVVIDADGVRGLSLDAIAGFAAMVALAEVDQAATAPRGSILSLTGEGRALPGPTERDMAFLQALYRLPLDRQARAHRNKLITDLAKAELNGFAPPR